MMMQQPPPRSVPPQPHRPPVTQSSDNRKAIIVVLCLVLFFGGALASDRIREADCRPRPVGGNGVYINMKRPRCDLIYPLWLYQWATGQGD